MIEDELRVRHLADIQAIIARLSQHSFVIRGWSVTLVSVVFAILASARREVWLLSAVALAPVLIFWGLDAYYLRQERLFRQHYTAAARRLAGGAEEPDVAAFDMDVSRYAASVPGFVRTLFAGHVLAIPAMLVLLICVYAVATL